MENERYKKGMEIIRRQLGPEADGYVEKIKKISEIFGRVNVEFPFADLYSRTVIDPKTREMITIGALTVQGYSQPELRVHIKGALYNGVTREEILEIITQMLAYCGFPAATNALLTAQEVFDELDKKDSNHGGK
ncbi:carboxymuconolactone decarboxylase family protein [Legionella fallonii]|uniref:Carboxymuconolactone decarboxylase family protein n=1 Tax=Legionella fallonii LLAP-10 TaxID=1212491 RepID=A0A098G9C7_9GAMM|nr:carboxymuconolactone decarboxylase family protein [Legionella fallonii]CEG58566.1 Carboxymuconolactone decarboxylase family protein [Legionella fallonii LLAP-10]